MMLSLHFREKGAERAVEIAVLSLLLAMRANGSDVHAGICKKESSVILQHPDYRLHATAISTETFELLSMCAQFCLAETICSCFNYNSISKLCEIISKRYLNNESLQFKAGTGWGHYVLQSEKVRLCTGNSITYRCFSCMGSKLWNSLSAWSKRGSSLYNFQKTV